MPSTPISKYFTAIEAVRSDTAEKLGISNVPSEIVSATILQTASYMDGIRDALGTPIMVSSWYRSPDLCIAIGSKITSQHTKGEAVDWASPKFGTPVEIAKFLASRMKELNIDQLIYEVRGGKEWIHTSFAISPPRKPRYQILSLLKSGGYATGITDPYGKLL